MNDIFSYNSDISKNAYLNWRTDKNDHAFNLFVLASDYSAGALCLINTVLADNHDKKADALIMPILYSIDQSIEVYIKAIIRKIEMLTDDKISNYKTHDVKELYGALIGHIKKDSAKTQGLQKHLLPLSSYIDELYSKIQTTNQGEKKELDIDFARYPIRVDGSPHYYIAADDNVVVDLENLRNRFLDIIEILEGLYNMYDVKSEEV